MYGFCFYLWSCNCDFGKAICCKIEIGIKKLDCIMLGKTLKGQKNNKWTRYRQTEVDGILGIIACLKWNWKKHIGWMKNDRWAQRMIQWRPRADKRLQRWPPTRWINNMTICWQNWIRIGRSWTVALGDYRRRFNINDVFQLLQYMVTICR